jgi:hypothetical protein
MEIRINIALLAALGVVSLSLTASDPVAAFDPNAAEIRELSFLEDEFAQDPSNELLARHLSSRYLELDRPGLVIAVVRAGDPSLVEDPMIAHRLAQAYEATDRLEDAHATAELALARCLRSLGSVDFTQTAVPEHGCSARDYAIFDMHRSALSHMVGWGVSEPSRDYRSRLAYDLAMRRATVASAD